MEKCLINVNSAVSHTSVIAFVLINVHLVMLQNYNAIVDVRSTRTINFRVLSRD